MITMKDIVLEGDPVLKAQAKDVELPLSNEDATTLDTMIEYIFNSIDEEKAKEFNLRPAVGIAAPQIGVSKKMLVIYAFDEKGNEFFLPIVNPRIVSYSDELTYLPGGEGCLSVNRTVEGLVHRPKRTTVSGYFYQEGKLEYGTRRLKNYISLVFNHEYDHLRGILFPERIDQEHPFKVPENSKPVIFEEEIDETV